MALLQTTSSTAWGRWDASMLQHLHCIFEISQHKAFCHLLRCLATCCFFSLLLLLLAPCVHAPPPQPRRCYRLKAAAGQLVLMAVLLTGCAVYTQHHVNSLQRADFTQQEYCEDSKAGATQITLHQASCRKRRLRVFGQQCSMQTCSSWSPAAAANVAPKVSVHFPIVARHCHKGQLAGLSLYPALHNQCRT